MAGTTDGLNIGFDIDFFFAGRYGMPFVLFYYYDFAVYFRDFAVINVIKLIIAG